MIPNNASREGIEPTPPTGPYRVLVWAGGHVEEIASRPETEEGREAAAKLFRGSQHPAALCRGATVIKRNGRGEARTAAFKAFAAGGASPAPTAAPVTPRPVEPTAAPVAPTTATTAEEPMAAKTEAAPSCAKCSKYPVALTTAKTHAGTEEWCTHCRRVDAMRRNGTAFGRHAKAPKKAAPAPKAAPKLSKPRVVAPTPQPAPAPASAVTHGATLADGLARVQRHAAIVASLGGVEAAEQFAALVADAGGVAVVVEAFTTLRGIA